MLEYITIESAITVESVGSGDSDAKVAEMDTSDNKTKHHYTSGPSTHLHLYHNSSTHNLFNLVMGEELRSGIFQ